MIQLNWKKAVAISSDNLEMNKLMGFQILIVKLAQWILDTRTFLKIFYQKTNFVFDLFHDLNEEVVLNHMTKKFTPIELSASIEKLNYLKPSIDLRQIKLDGSKASLGPKGYLKRNWCSNNEFFSIFSFINTKFLSSDSIYQQYIILRKIVNFLMNPVVNTSNLD